MGKHISNEAGNNILIHLRVAMTSTVTFGEYLTFPYVRRVNKMCLLRFQRAVN